MKGPKPAPLPVDGGGDVGLPPSDMSEAAKGKWAEAADEWRAVLAESDRDALRMYCEAWAEMVNAQRRVEEDGAMILTPNGMVQKSPWMTKVEHSREFCRKMLSEFLGSPSARARAEGLAEPPAGPATTEADEYLD